MPDQDPSKELAKQILKIATADDDVVALEEIARLKQIPTSDVDDEDEAEAIAALEEMARREEADQASRLPPA